MKEVPIIIPYPRRDGNGFAGKAGPNPAEKGERPCICPTRKQPASGQWKREQRRPYGREGVVGAITIIIIVTKRSAALPFQP